MTKGTIKKIIARLVSTVVIPTVIMTSDPVIALAETDYADTPASNNTLSQNETIDFIPVQDGYYAVPGSTANDLATSQRLGLEALDAVYKEVGSLAYLDVKYLQRSNGTYTMVLSQKDISTINTMHASVGAWLDSNMKTIVPNGTSKDRAITLVANWVANNMTYDYNATSDRNLLVSYQNALSCFEKGTGVCVTYATAFNCMIDYLPINSMTDRVDYYSTGGTFTIPTKLISNDTHAWSALGESDGWHLYDITFYDNDDGYKSAEYLNMSFATANDGYHSNIRTNLGGSQAIAYNTGH
ncbi:MAG: transglutaminase-like domain-containing protein [Lachnospiraceae bacterium]|nr:transglutaminase-like domain-containing protein [Lachnospiraceae bacterium]